MVLNDSQVIVDPLIKGLPPSVYREHTADMGLWYSLYSPLIKGLPQIKFHVVPKGLFTILMR